MLHIYGIELESSRGLPSWSGGWNTCGSRELGLFSCRKRRLREIVLLSSTACWQEMKWRQILAGTQWCAKKQWTQVGMWEILIRYNFLIYLFFYHKGGEILEQGPWEVVASSILGGAWNLGGMKPLYSLTCFKGKVEPEVSSKLNY